tara:strand:- start:6334 stop:7122 length:789 start_codon:yes stop_codon:yes gene_type:complete
MTQGYKCVICLAKSGSSQIAKNFRQQGALHEYDFKTIAELAINRNIDRSELLKYMQERKKRLEGKIDVSTTLIHICDKPMIEELNMRPIFLIREPLDWISSMIKYAIKTEDINELDLDGGWRKEYGKVFIKNEKIPFSGLKNIQPRTIKRLIKPLMRTWTEYTDKLYNLALHSKDGISNVYPTDSLGKIETHTKISKYYNLEDRPPMNFFLISNQTKDIYNIKKEIINQEPVLSKIKLKDEADIISSINNMNLELNNEKQNG